MRAFRCMAHQSLWIFVLVLALLSLGACMGGPRLASLDAEVVPADPLDLPSDAELTVRLEDVSRADARADVIAESTYTRLGAGPIPVTLRYAPAAIDARHRYALRAQIRVDGRLTHTNTTQVPVLTRDAPSDAVRLPIEEVRR